MLRKLGIATFSVGVLALALTAHSAHAQAVDAGWQGRALTTQSIDENRRVMLGGNTHPRANAANDRGSVADDFLMEHMLLQLKRPAEQERALEQLIDELHNPQSPDFHKWLTAQEFGERFGLAQQDLDTIKGWLESHGLKVNVTYPSRTVIDFSGTAGQVREAFRTEIHHLNVAGEEHIANIRNPSIPAALAPAVSGVVSLHDFRPHPMHKIHNARPDFSFPDGLGGTTYALVPADLATIYNLNPLFNAGYTGQGQTIVVIEDTDVFSISDWSTFRSTFGLSGYTSGSFTTVHPAPPSGTNNCNSPGAFAPNDAEAILDAEWASASAPGAAILMASCADTGTTFGGLIALQNLINASSQPPPIVSISYGQCETENGASANAAYSSVYQQAVAEGVSVFVAAGDSGAAGCDNNVAEATHGIGVSAFASTPYNVAVGGTDFSDTFSGTNSVYWNSTNTPAYGSAISYIPEIPWNDSCGSVLISIALTGSPITYGPDGLCNGIFGSFLMTTVAGGGGPSGCATGAPSVSGSGVVSGTCQGWPKPSWQSVLGNPSDGVRDTPDVSLFAADGFWSHSYIFCWSDTVHGGAVCAGDPSGWTPAGGTSFASPIMAGIQALVNQKTGARQGNPNPVYYQLAATEYGSSGSTACDSSNGNTVSAACVFYDVTLGDMDVDCIGSNNCFMPSVGVLSTSDNSYSPAYGTTIGWDFATGIGTINAANLVNNWPMSSAGPTLATINPVSGQQGQAINPVTLTGTNLSGATINALSGITVSNVTATAAQVTATFTIASNAPTGPQNVTVATAGGTSNALVFTVNAAPPPAPTLASVSPNSGVQGTNVNVTLTGTNFVAPTTINFGGAGVTVTGTTVMNSTTITATFNLAANAALGAQNVSVTANGGTSGNATFTVISSVPTLSSVSPSSGQAGTAVNVTLTGTNFISGQTTVKSSRPAVKVSNVNVVSSTQITATLTILADALPTTLLSVTTPNGTSGTVTFNVTPPVPVLTSISPTSGVQGTSVNVTLMGTNFTTPLTVNYGGTGVTVTGTTVKWTSITATFTISSSAATGPQSVTVTTPGGTSGAVTFTVNPSLGGAPTLASVSPNSGVQGNNVGVTLTGTNFVAPATVNFGGAGVTVAGTTVTNSTTVTATFNIAANAALGAQNVSVTTAGGTSGNVTFTVNPPAPTLTSLSQTTGVQGTSVGVTLTGTNFVAPATVNFGGAGVTVTGTTVMNSTTITATFNIAANAALGAQIVSVTTAGGTSGNVAFTVNPPAPTLTSLSQTTGVQGTSVGVTLTGTNFVAPATVNFGGAGVTVAGTAVTNSTTVTATFNIAANAALGAQNVSVTTSGGTSGNVAFTVNPPAPTLSTIAPASGQQGQTINPVTLTGTNLSGATINALSGITVSNVIATATQVTATFTIASNATTGLQNVTVTTAGGTSNALVFTVNMAPSPAPTLASVSPGNGVQGTNVSVTLTGTNFVSPATINFGGAGVTVTGTTVVNSTTMTATFNIAANAVLGAQNVSVTTAGGTSGNVTFMVNPPAPTLTSISPSQLILGNAATFTLTGTNFVPGNTAINNSFPGLTVSNVSVTSSTSMTATFAVAANAQIGSAFFSVTTAGGTSGTRGIDIIGVPILNSISPASGARGSSFTVTLSGSQLSLGQIHFSGTGITATNRKINTPLYTMLTYTFTIASNAPTGPQSVTVTNPAGTSAAVTFTVN
jgi:hypothetical protein